MIRPNSATFWPATKCCLCRSRKKTGRERENIFSSEKILQRAVSDSKGNYRTFPLCALLPAAVHRCRNSLLANIFALRRPLKHGASQLRDVADFFATFGAGSISSLLSPRSLIDVAIERQSAIRDARRSYQILGMGRLHRRIRPRSRTVSRSRCRIEYARQRVGTLDQFRFPY